MSPLMQTILDDSVVSSFIPNAESIRKKSMKPSYPWAHLVYTYLFQSTYLKDMVGDIIEFGVANGGTLALLSSLCKNPGDNVIGFDSFCGLPCPNKKHNVSYFAKNDYAPKSGNGYLMMIESLKFIKLISKKENVTLINGYFKETLKNHKFNKVKFVNIDADLYESTLIALESTYENINDCGFIALDDFFHPSQGPRLAAQRFFSTKGIIPVYEVVFPFGVTICKKEADLKDFHQCHDGNFYSFSLMRKIPGIRQAVDAGLRKHPNDQELKGLLALLRGEVPKHQEIYHYWISMSSFWASCRSGNIRIKSNS